MDICLTENNTAKKSFHYYKVVVAIFSVKTTTVNPTALFS